MTGRVRPWETLSTESALDHRWYRVRRETVRLADGRVLDDYFVSVRPDVALVVALTPHEELVLVRQWKQGVRSVMLELPGGVCDDGEAPSVTAARELREETGYAAESLEPLGVWAVDPSKSTGLVHLFLARDATRVHEQTLDENEAIEVVTMPPAEARAAIADGAISAVATVAGILAALARTSG